MVVKRWLYMIFALLAMQGLSSCVYDAAADCPPEIPVADDPQMVNLSFSVVALVGGDPDASRAEPSTTPNENDYFEDALDEYELIHQLRVIIIRENGEIEQNRMVTIKDGAIRYDNLEFLVRSGEKKKIYLMANCENVDYDFDRLKPNSAYTEPLMEDIVINAAENTNTLVDNSVNTTEMRYVPMSEVHEVRIDHPDDGMQVSDVKIGPLFITRAAVKFSFSISAYYGSGLFITGITVNKIANKEFLLPKEATYFPPKEDSPIANWDGAPNPDLLGRFITDYTTPGAATYSSVFFTPQTPIELSPDKTVDCSPALYYCESLFNDPYSVSIAVAEKDSEGNFGEPINFNPVDLPNLPLLPRNTHVKINMTLGKTEIQDCEVSIVPYIGVALDPIFGADRDNTPIETPQ